MAAPLTLAALLQAFKVDLKSVKTLVGLSAVLGVPAQKLGYYVYKRSPAGQYKTFSIARKKGGTRTIHAPKTNLRLIQEKIARELDKLRTFGPAVNGYVAGRSIVSNATPHVGKKYVLNIDLEDFFGTITAKRLYGMLASKPYELAPKVAAYIVNACTLNGSLPQGAPSSPVLSNLICARLDADFLKLARALRCTYTRYADDITFSSNGDAIRRLVSVDMATDDTGIAVSLSPLVTGVIAKNGFVPNLGKVRFSEKGARQEVTGLIVNEKVNVKRRLVRQVRAMLHAWRTFGYDKAEAEFHAKYDYTGSNASFAKVIYGRISFIRHIKGGGDSVSLALALAFNALNSALPPEKRLLPLSTQLSEKEVTARAVWVLEDHTTTSQGTAFFLEGVGLVTCAHCVSPSMYVTHPSMPGQKHDVSVLKADKHRDLAILQLAVPLSTIGATSLKEGNFDAMNVGDTLTLFGYPKHSFAFPVRVETGQFVRAFTRSAVRFCEITPRIVSGNSGGPILDKNGRVVAVATSGVSNGLIDNDAQFFGVSIRMLKGM